MQYTWRTTPKKQNNFCNLLLLDLLVVPSIAMNLSQALVTEFESHKAHPFFVSYLVSDNNDTDSDATLNKDPQEINLNAAKELLRYQPFRFLWSTSEINYF